MNRIESTLRAVRTQVQFELVEVAAEVVRAAARAVSAQDEMKQADRRCNAAAGELRATMAAAPMNPALVRAMGRIYDGERSVLRAARSQLAAAKRLEDDARTALADVRNRERSLERALQEEQRKRRAQQQAFELIQADELWLQGAREAS